MPDDLDLRDVHGLHEPDPTFRLELRRQVEAIVRAPAFPRPSAASDEEGLIMLTDTRTEPPEASNRTRRWVLPAAAAAVVVIVAVAVIAFASDGDQTTVAGPRDPRPIVEGMGTFPAGSGPLEGYIVELSATESGGEVTGFAEFRAAGAAPLRITLSCSTETADGVVIVGGEVSESDSSERPVGSRAAVLVQASPTFTDPTEVGLWFEGTTEHGTCDEFLASIPAEPIDPNSMFPAFGDIEVGGGDDEAPGSARTVFEDGFDDDSGGWLTTQGFGMTVETGGGRQTWTLTSGGASDVQRPLTLRELVRDMEVTLDVVSVTPGDTVAALCRKGLSAPEDQFYAFRLGPDGASIGVVGKTDLAQTLASDPSVAVPSGPFELTASCVDVDGVAQLEMRVDGEVVLRASDTDPLEAGVGGIRVQAGTDSARDGEVVLDRIVVRELG